MGLVGQRESRGGLYDWQAWFFRSLYRHSKVCLLIELVSQRGSRGGLYDRQNRRNNTDAVAVMSEGVCMCRVCVCVSCFSVCVGLFLGGEEEVAGLDC